MRPTMLLGAAAAVLVLAGCSTESHATSSGPTVADSGWTGWWGSVTLLEVPAPEPSASRTPATVPAPPRCREVRIPSDVLFDENSATPRDQAALQRAVRQAVQAAEQVPGTVVVEGFTDNQGAENIPLSERRAQVPADALVASGIDAGRIVVVGRGSADPVATNETASGRAQNRRVEIHVGECAVDGDRPTADGA